MSVCTGTRVPAKTGVPLNRSGDVVIRGADTFSSASSAEPLAQEALGWLTSARFSAGVVRCKHELEGGRTTLSFLAGSHEVAYPKSHRQRPGKTSAWPWRVDGESHDIRRSQLEGWVGDRREAVRDAIDGVLSPAPDERGRMPGLMASRALRDVEEVT
jgi:hypothetical protein